MIEIESTKGNYEKALKEVDKLIADNERALEPRMTKGRILQQWCEKDPSHYPEAVQHWAKTRDLLRRMKKKPPELIEVVYTTDHWATTRKPISSSRMREAQASPPTL